MYRKTKTKAKIRVFIICLLLFCNLILPLGYGDKFGILAFASADIISDIPEYSGSPYVAINDNVPDFDEADFTANSFESYSELDSLGRCGVAYANLGIDLMPTEDRGDISSIYPTGWVQNTYDEISGGYLYNRCHLIAFELAAENANERNLITGTRYFNIEGMLPFENMVADYIKETNNHVLYRVTPIFEENNLLASGVQMEAESVEDEGEGILFNVFCYNVQPGILIDYADGENFLEDDIVISSDDADELNVNKVDSEKDILETENPNETSVAESDEETVSEEPIEEDTEEKSEEVEETGEQTVDTFDLTKMTRDELNEIKDEADSAIKEYHKPDSKTKEKALDIVKNEVEEIFAQEDISVSWPWFDYEYTRNWDFYTVSTNLKYKEADSKKSKKAEVYAELIISGEEAIIYYLTVADTVVIDIRDQIPEELWINAPESSINALTGLDFSIMDEEDLEKLKDRIQDEIKADHTTDSSVEDLVLSMTKYQVENQYNDVSWPWINYDYTCDWGFYTLSTSMNYKDADEKKQKEKVYAEAYLSDNNYELFYLSVGDDILIDNRSKLPEKFYDEELLETEEEGVQTETKSLETPIEETEKVTTDQGLETNLETESEGKQNKTEKDTETNDVTEKETETNAEEILYQKGSRNDLVRELQSKLSYLGYLSGSLDGIFGDATEEAVKDFQKDHGLEETGYVTKETMNKIISEEDSLIEEKREEQTEAVTEQAKEISNGAGERMVWIPSSGIKYHSNPGCSNMVNPRQVTEAEAKSMGYEACQKCY